MRERLPVVLEEREMPIDNFRKNNMQKASYGYASFLYLLSAVITTVSVLLVIFLGNR